MNKLISKKKFRLVPASGRGALEDPNSQISAFYNTYSDFMKSFNEKADDEKQAFKDHFNGLVAEREDLGDVLTCGSVDDLKFAVGTWDTEDIEAVMAELVKLEYVELPEDDD